MRRAVVPLLATLLLGVGAIGAPVGVAEPARCYPARAVFPDEVRRLTGTLDGDLLPDEVRTAVRWIDRDTCEGRLVVTLADGAVLRRRIEARLGVLIGPPGLAGLVELDRRRGLEIAVVTWRGASTGFVELYGIRRDEVDALTVDVFEYAGSIVHPSGVDCTWRRGADLVSSRATYVLANDRYEVRRTFYAFRAGTLRPVPRLSQHVSVRPGGLGRFPELLAGVPFPSCTAVSGAA